MFELFLIVVCIGMNAFLAGFETAFVAVSRPLVRRLAKDKETLKSLLSLKENPERTLSVIQVGITFVGVFAAAVGGAGAEKALSPFYTHVLGLSENIAELLALLTVTAPLTYFTVVFGELIPKTVALRNPLNLAARFSPLIKKLSRVFWPVVLLLEKSTKSLLTLIPGIGESEKAHPDYVSEEFSTMSAPSKEYILNLLKLEKTKVVSVMIPWKGVDRLSIDQSLEEVEDVIIKSGHTRMPVFEKDQVKGILNAKEFLALLKAGETDWQGMIHGAVLIFDRAPLLAAFRLMQKEKAHMAIVKDLHGVHQGIVTMEDIFEEIVGDIYDEDDEGSILRILAKR